MSCRYFFPLLTAFLLSLAWSTAAHAQVDWTHFSTEAVLYADNVEEEWSEGAVWAPTVIRAEGDTLKMWYTGAEDIFVDSQIGYAWSLDGVSWTRHPDNPVIVPEGNATFAENPRVLSDGDVLRMWYAEGSDRDPVNPDFVIRYATSTDGGVTWDRHPDPVLEPGPAGTWNATAVFPGDVIKEDGLFKMWFTGGVGTLFGFVIPTAYSIGYATSPDGIAWTLYDDPATTEPPFHLSDPVVLHGTSNLDINWASSATVRRAEEGYEMWYDDGTESSPSHSDISYATSPDGIAWTKYAGNPVLTIEGGPVASRLYNPSVLFYDDQYHMWLSLFDFVAPTLFANVGYATAPVTPVAVEPGTVPSGALALRPPFPNPTAAGASLTYRLDEVAHVLLTVYDLLGREVARPVDDARPAGEHTAMWDGLDASGRRLGAGVYVVRLRAGDATESRKVLLLR